MSPASQILVNNGAGGRRVFLQLGVFPLGWERDAIVPRLGGNMMLGYRGHTMGTLLVALATPWAPSGVLWALLGRPWPRFGFPLARLPWDTRWITRSTPWATFFPAPIAQDLLQQILGPRIA